MRSNRHLPAFEVVPRPWRSLLASSLLAVLLAPVAGCELVLGMTGHDAVEASGAVDSGSDAPTDAPPAVCVLPSTGDANARVTNLVPATGRLDFCFKPESGAAIGPIFGAPGCPAGLGYKESSAAFKIPSGSYELDVIKGGGTCSDKAIASIQHVTFEAGTSTNAISMGDGAADFALKTLKETAPATLASKFRFVHAIDGLPNQDFGASTKTTLPAQFISTYFQNVPFGASASPGSGPGGTIDANGYVDFAGSGAVLNLGRANVGSKDMLDITAAKLVLKTGYTIYAVGRTDTTGKPNDPKFPPELLLCNEQTADGLYARCANALPLDVTLDIVNTQLNGPYAAFESLRRGPIQDAISKLGGDVACVTEVWSEADKDAIVNAAKSKYGFAARFPADLNTALDDATDQSGAVPPARTTAACADAQSKTDLEAYLACLTKNCAVTKGDSSSTIQDQAADCITTNCGGEALTLALSEPACWDCQLTEFFGRASFAAAKTACETDPLARYSYNGTNGVLLLSRYPFDGSPEVVNIGATDFRVSLIRAPLALDGGGKLDAYCVVTTTPATGQTRPYVGDYGHTTHACTKDADCNTSAGETCDTAVDLCIGSSDDQWRQELLLQVGKVTKQAQTRSAALKRRAVVLGDWYTGPKVGALSDLNVESFDALTAAMPLALADGFTPACTYCSDNPIFTPPGTTPSGASYWSTFGVLSGIPITDVRSNQVILKDATIQVPMATYKIPVSPYYGFRTVVRIRP